MPKQFADVQVILNYVLSFAFFMEMVVKLLALGPKEYAQDAFNIFDAVVVLLSAVEILLPIISGGDGGGGSLSALRALRILRVLKLAKSWVSLKRLLGCLGRAWPSIAPLFLLMLLYIFVFGMIGSQLFGPDYPVDVRSNFASLLPGEFGYGSMVTVFQVYIVMAHIIMAYVVMVSSATARW